MELKNDIALTYSNGLSTALNTDSNVGGEDRAVVERNMTYVRSQSDIQGQEGVLLDDD